MPPGSFDGIQSLLAKYRKIFLARDNEREKIHKIITQISGIVLPKSNLIISKGKLYIKESSVVKNELFLYKESIIEELHKVGITNINEIC